MTLTRAKIHCIAVVLGAALSAGCASAPPPLAELAEAQTQISRAQSAGAQGSAPVELRFALEKLALAQAAIEKRDHKSATALATQAKVDAELAAAKALAASARDAVRAKVDDNSRLQRTLLSEDGTL